MSHGDVIKIQLIHRHQLNFLYALLLLVVKQWGKQLVQNGQEYPLPLSFITAFCGVANDIGSGTRILGIEIRTSTFIIYIKDNPSGTIQFIAIGR